MRELGGRESRVYFRRWSRAVSAAPVTAADATSKSRKVQKLNSTPASSRLADAHDRLRGCERVWRSAYAFRFGDLGVESGVGLPSDRRDFSFWTLRDHRRLKQRIGPMLGSSDSTRPRLQSVALNWRKRSRRFSSESASLFISFATAPEFWKILLAHDAKRAADNLTV